MKAKNVLEIIETKYAVADVRLADGTPIWPFIRQAIYFQIQNKTLQYSNKLRTRNKFTLLKNFFYGMSHLFSLKKYEILFFNNTNKRELHNNRYFDIYYDAWADCLGQERSLFIEWAIESHLPKNSVYSEHVISDLPFKLWAKLISFFIKVEIQNGHILEAISTEYEVSINFQKLLKNKLAEVKWHKYLFKKINPKKIFVLSSFTKVSIVYAAKSLKIPVYEPQHGFMGSTHPFYNTVQKFPDFYPDTLLSFGTSEKRANEPTFIFEPKDIIPVGSLQLDLAKLRALPKCLTELQQQYTTIFCVTLQAIKDEELLQWLDKQSKIHPDWVFIIRPKQPKFNLSLYIEAANIIMLPNVSTYDVLKASDFNITIFSTTVIEGIYLGAKPILVNIDNLPKKYFNLEHATIALIENYEPITEIHLSKPGTFPNPYFISNYFENVENAASCF